MLSEFSNMPKDFFFVKPDGGGMAKVKSRKLKPASTLDGVFPSINSAAKHFNVGIRAIKLG